eukprot:TRINITY_DN54030_c0_g1_i1.p1 TRINITY_DN54030_c0_g1~~TRINITY_DN54030_c0_g1_i1.p1  ORF type:complete len:355 (+),score=79.41 TRINITY_DN54030_c0_g1_i1:105-1067(+)
MAAEGRERSRSPRRTADDAPAGAGDPNAVAAMAAPPGADAAAAGLQSADGYAITPAAAGQIAPTGDPSAQGQQPGMDQAQLAYQQQLQAQQAQMAQQQQVYQQQMMMYQQQQQQGVPQMGMGMAMTYPMGMGMTYQQPMMAVQQPGMMMQPGVTSFPQTAVSYQQPTSMTGCGMYQQMVAAMPTAASQPPSVGGTTVGAGDDQRFESTIKLVHSKRTFGFIARPPNLQNDSPDGPNKDIYVSLADIGQLAVGDTVSFSVRRQRDGKPMAKDIRLVAKAAPGGMPGIPGMAAPLMPGMVGGMMSGGMDPSAGCVGGLGATV